MADHSNAKGIYRSIYPAIISTCRLVHEEARTVLYANNEFRFTDFPVYTEHESVFREQCDNIFKYSERDWLRSDGPSLLSKAPIARFLNKIGARNAASLEVVELTVYYGTAETLYYPTADDWRAASSNALATDLLVCHMPTLKTLRVLVRQYPREYIQHEDADIRARLDRKKLAVQRFCSTLRDLARGRFSLEVFDYKGSHFGAVQELKARPEYSGEFAPLLREGKETNASDTDSN